MNQLSLPEEFVLLLHRPEGSFYASDHTGAAELGELVLNRQVELTNKKVTPLATAPTGRAWADDALAWLHRKGKPVQAATFIQSRTNARRRHADALVARGLMYCEQKKFLFIPYQKYFPELSTRNLLVGRVRAAARDEVPLDERLALLCALTQATGLAPKLGLDSAERARLKQISKGEQVGEAVSDVITATMTVIAVAGAAAAAGGAAGS